MSSKLGTFVFPRVTLFALLFVLLGHIETPILSIPEFRNDLQKFYYSDISSHLKRNEERINKPHAHDFYLCVIFNEGRVYMRSILKNMIYPQAAFF